MLNPSSISVAKRLVNRQSASGSGVSKGVVVVNLMSPWKGFRASVFWVHRRIRNHWLLTCGAVETLRDRCGLRPSKVAHR